MTISVPSFLSPPKVARPASRTLEVKVSSKARFFSNSLKRLSQVSLIVCPTNREFKKFEASINADGGISRGTSMIQESANNDTREQEPESWAVGDVHVRG